VHHEVVAPNDGDPYVHGWTALFGADFGTEPPVLERFGPAPAPALRSSPGVELFAPDGIELAPSSLAGEAGRLAWDLTFEHSGSGPSPLFTFPRWAWEREVLPAAQVVCVPSSPLSGSLLVDGKRVPLSPDASGGLAHIYGHGSAERWGWLHADLGGGDVLEVVSAVSRRPGLRRLPPLAFVQLRLGGRDWPRDPLVAAPLFRTELRLPTWHVAGTVGRFRLRVDVNIEPSRAVSLSYTDPDGSTATCTNSEVADAEILLERRSDAWQTVSSWSLQASAHSEIGTRP
jgi:hypothetical protein